MASATYLAQVLTIKDNGEIIGQIIVKTISFGHRPNH